MSALDEVTGYSKHANACNYSRGNGVCNCIVGEAKQELSDLRTALEEAKAIDNTPEEDGIEDAYYKWLSKWGDK